MSVAVDFVGYEVLIDYINKYRLYTLPGDFIEIGAFVGGGTRKLAMLAGSVGKKVYVIDIFDLKADDTASVDGTKMSDIYLAYLEGRSQYNEYRNNTRGFDNIVTIKQDSKTVKLPLTQRFSFGFVDGNHQAEYVMNDFLLVWNHLVSNGVVALHDYRTGLPEVTRTIDRLLEEKRDKIAGTFVILDKNIILVTKRPG